MRGGGRLHGLRKGGVVSRLEPCAGFALLLLRGRAHTGFASAHRLAMAPPQRVALHSGLSLLTS